MLQELAPVPQEAWGILHRPPAALVAEQRDIHPPVSLPPALKQPLAAQESAPVAWTMEAGQTCPQYSMRVRSYLRRAGRSL